MPIITVPEEHDKIKLLFTAAFRDDIIKMRQNLPLCGQVASRLGTSDGPAAVSRCELIERLVEADKVVLIDELAAPARVLVYDYYFRARIEVPSCGVEGIHARVTWQYVSDEW